MTMLYEFSFKLYKTTEIRMKMTQSSEVGVESMSFYLYRRWFLCGLPFVVVVVTVIVFDAILYAFMH